MENAEKETENLTFMDQYDFTENDAEVLLNRWFPEKKTNSKFEAKLKEILGEDYPESSR